MQTAKILCKCGKQVTYIEEFAEPSFQSREFELMQLQGYEVVIGEDLPQSEFCLEPCSDVSACAYKEHFSTSPGFKSIYTWVQKEC